MNHSRLFPQGTWFRVVALGGLVLLGHSVLRADPVPPRTATPQPAPTLARPPTIVRPLQLPVFTALPSSCSEGQLVMVHGATSSKVYVCATTTATGPCITRTPVTRVECLPATTCATRGGREGSSCGFAQRDCELPNGEICTAYQNDVVTTWVQL